MTEGPDRSGKGPDPRVRDYIDVSWFRRSLIRALDDTPEAGLTIDSLVDVVLEGTSGRPFLPGRRREVRARLHHVDLPAFDDAGVLDYDPDTNEIQYVDSERLEQLRRNAGETDESPR